MVFVDDDGEAVCTSGAESSSFTFQPQLIYSVSSDGTVIVGTSLTSGSTGSDHAFRWTATTCNTIGAETSAVSRCILGPTWKT
jgi:probable HAF family extracellular repeat protein